MQKCFDTKKRIRLGIWGLGRGSNFIKAANAVNIDIVAGCDYNADLQEKFRQACPDAFITADQNEFLAFKNMDAVLIATYASPYMSVYALKSAVSKRLCGDSSAERTVQPCLPGTAT